jgi:hypothetical protein
MLQNLSSCDDFRASSVNQHFRTSFGKVIRVMTFFILKNSPLGDAYVDKFCLQEKEAYAHRFVDETGMDEA